MHGKPLTLSVLAHQAVVSCTVDTAAIKVRYRLAIVGTKTMGEMVVYVGACTLGYRVYSYSNTLSQTGTVV